MRLSFFIAAVFGLVAQVSQLVAKDVVAVYDLEGALTEAGAGGNSLFNLASQDRPLTFFDVTRSLAKAAADGQVKAVVLELDGAALNFAQLQELQRRMLELRKQGKAVWLYTENITNGIAMLGSAADHFILMPEGNVAFSGLSSESLYFKGMLDKMGIAAEVIHIGDFKSAGENLYREGPSEPAAKQSGQLLDDIYGQLLDKVAQARGMDRADLENFVDAGWNTPDQALQAGLVDALQYRTDLTAKLRETYADAEFDRDYGMEGVDGPEIDSIFKLFSLLFKGEDEGSSNKDYLAVVVMEGAISDASIAPVRETILKLAKDEKAKALVLRVDSPGGSALSSDVLWEATDEWRATERPFVVSMGGVAASGGYYIAAGADRIFAEEGTITGSIGVVGMKLVLNGAMKKAGITVHREQRGANAGVMSMTRSYTEEETQLVRQSMLDVYGTFKKRVSEGRGERLVKSVDELGGGRVYSGARALSLGLVDEIGGLEEAIQAAASKAGIDATQSNAVKLVPRPKSPFEEFFAKQDEESNDILRMTVSLENPFLQSLRRDLLALPLSGLASPGQKRQMNDLFEQLRAMQSGQVMLIGNAPGLSW